MNNLGIGQFMPHGFCISWDPTLLTLHVVSDFFVALAYFSIPAGILWAVKKRKELKFAPVYYLFAGFILACGVTHVLGIWTLWVPSYYLEGYAKAFTALISMATALYLLPKIPQILALPDLSELTSINNRLASQIEAQRKAELEIKETSDKLRKALMVQNEFLVNMSHEVRTPMTGVIGCLSLIERGELSPGQLELVNDAQVSAQSLLNLLNSLLDLSKIDAGELELNLAPVEQGSFISETVRAFRGAALEKGLSLNCRLDCEQDVLMVVDAVRLQQVTQNLVSNAVKFTEAGGVDVLFQSRKVSNDSLKLRLEVTDTGAGISEAENDRIFERFVQLDGSSTRKGQGTGLGLAISRQLVELMGGEIWVEKPESGGCRFVVELTVDSLPVDSAQRSKLEGAGKKRASELQAQFLASLGRRKVLLVDDVQINRKVLGRLLENVGFEVVLASDGQEALSLLPGGRFDLVLMDCQMPVLDGYQTTEQIRSGLLEGVDPAIPVLALTGHATKQDRDRCLKSGMNDYLVKPLDMESFFVVATRLLT